MEEEDTKKQSRRRKVARNLLKSFPKDEDLLEILNRFQFPLPPEADTFTDSSSNRDDRPCLSCKENYYDKGYRSDGNQPLRPPPIGVFWDIENCQIPHGKSAVLVAQAIRERFFKGFREAEFVVVCDVKKESPLIIQELNDAQVNLIHVASLSKNAADEKLRQAMRRFADIHGFPAAIILISGDVNFATDLCDLRHRKNLHIILLHNSSCSFALALCANEHYNFDHFVLPIPPRSMIKNWKREREPMEVMIWNLPKGCTTNKLKDKLKFLSHNCGGRISFISETTAVVQFVSFELAVRARKRMNGEIMFGNQIGVSYPQKAGTLKRDTIDVSNGQYEHFFSNNGRAISQNDQQPENMMLENGSKPKYFRSASLQESSSQSAQTVPFENSCIWDTLQDTFSNEINDLASTSTSDTESVAEELKRINNSQQNGKCCIENSKTKDIFNPSELTDFGIINKEPLVFQQEPLCKVNGTTKKCRTPSPYLANSHKPFATNPVSQTRMRKSYPDIDPEKYFNPIQSPLFPHHGSPVELLVTNLDQSIDPMEMKKIVLSIFSEHVTVLHIYLFLQSDGNFASSIKLRTIQDAQFAISQLHRRKIGYKRIMISYAHSSQPHNPQFIRWQIVAILQDVPGYKLPLFKFISLFESRYVSTISVSDLYRLKDVCIITEESTGRMITLNPEHRSSPSSFTSPQAVEPFCSKHCRINNSAGKGWAEQEVPPLPNVNVPLKEFSSYLVRLVATHCNALPLSSFIDCYEAECKSLSIVENGVPLEHLVTCVDKVELASVNGVKYLKPTHSQNFLDDKTEDVTKSVSPSLVSQLTLFGRELFDLLKSHPHSLLLFNRLIPAYHHYFGRQCRVADYGFTKLIDLLEALPNIAQVIGEGNKRTVTICHRAQMKRFTTDLLRVLRSQTNKKLNFEEIPQAFERTLGKPFDPVDYGLCSLLDLLDHVPSSTVLICRGQIITLSIPQREKTQDEIDRTKLFSKEVIELLGHAPQCSILFHQFIPAYHHHYGHQCRVADFGFTKLIELFEAIPDIVKLEEDTEGERIVSLTQQQKLFVIGEQIFDIVFPTYPPGLPLQNISSSYRWCYGYVLKSQTYGYESLDDLIAAVDTVMLETDENGTIVVPVEEAIVKQLMSQVRKLMIHSEDEKMKFSKLISQFPAFHASFLTPSIITAHLADAISIKTDKDEQIVELTDIYQIGRRLVKILNANNGHLSLSALESAYHWQGVELTGHPNLASVITALPLIATMKGKTFKRHVILNKDLVFKKESGKAVCRPSSTSALPSETSDRLDNPSITSYAFPVINLPEMEILPEHLLQNAYSLISPCKGLLPPSARPPHPSQLPFPSAFSSKIKNGVEGKSSVNIPDKTSEDKEVSSSTTFKRKLRLAAQFQTPVDLN